MSLTRQSYIGSFLGTDHRLLISFFEGMTCSPQISAKPLEGWDPRNRNPSGGGSYSRPLRQVRGGQSGAESRMADTLDEAKAAFAKRCEEVKREMMDHGSGWRQPSKASSQFGTARALELLASSPHGATQELLRTAPASAGGWSLASSSLGLRQCDEE